MKISYNWLKEFVDFNIPPAQLAEDLTNIGIVVETIELIGDDHIMNLDLTTNRPDCLSHAGVAREVSAHYNLPLKWVPSQPEESSIPCNSAIGVQIDSPQYCSRYCARIIRDVRVGLSPKWLSQRLENLGVRSINNVVDITNYVLLEQGHPLHAFDLSKVDGGRIIVREAQDGETLVTIDGTERKLKEGMLLIADPTRGLALAGIMGGLESEISSSSTNVLLESAWFDPISIRKTSKSLAMHTEASHRFERGADVSATVSSIDRAAQLIQQLAGGEVFKGVVDAYPGYSLRPTIRLRSARISQIMGVDIESGYIGDLLKALGFRISASDATGWDIQPPTSRLDVTREIDLIEEIARHYGYGRFPSTLPNWRGAPTRRREVVRVREIKQKLSGLGYHETLTYPFISARENRRFSTHVPVQLLNPISAETEVMRTSLLPGLLSSFLRNYNRGMKTARLYELGRLYLGMEGDISREEESLGMINSGFAQEKTPYGEAVSFGFFDLKGDVEILLEAVRLPVDRVSYVRSPGSSADLEYYHPAVACELWIDQTKIGIMGRLHPELCEAYKIRQPVFAAELQLGLCYRFQVDEQIFREFPKYPSVQRDISIIVDKSTEYKAIEWAILSVGIEEVQQVYPFDLYLGDKLPASKKGVSISIVFQSKDRTLLEEEIVQYQESILKALSQKLGATLRT